VSNKYVDKEQMSNDKSSEEKKGRKSPKTSKAVTQILSGDFLSREFVIENLGFIFYIMFLLLLLVAKGYYVKQVSDNVIKTEFELDEIVSDYVELKARFQEETSRGNLLKKLEGTGLVESIEPPKVIRVLEKKEENN
jgi:hypothetical protein